VLAWGAGASGQLGNGTTTDAGTPVAVLGVRGAGTLDNATVVAAGGDSSYAVLADGTVAAWGDGGHGALGNGSTADADVPMLASGVGGTGSLSGITSVAGGEFDGLALTSGGSVDAWGYNADGELGDSSTSDSPVPVPVSSVGGAGTLSGVTAIGAGGFDDVALLSTGAVDDWGSDQYGQLGELGDNDASASTSCGCATAPVAVQGISDVVAIAGGQFSSYALKADGTLWAWGNDSNGELANGGTADVALPQQVTAAGTKVTAIASGQYASHVLAIEAVAPAEVSPPVISGQAAIGQQLTASTGVWSGTRPLTYSYQWERCSSSCTSIAAAYTLRAADAGDGIRVAVTASNSAGSAVSRSAHSSIPASPARRDRSPSRLGC
jgi:alpha-tubulin suppressor-like RCC1 family protein